MLYRVRRTIRPIAAALVVALVAVVSAECVPDRYISAAEKICCAAMGHACGARVEQSCCSVQPTQVAQSAAVKPLSVSAPTVPVAAVFSVLSPAALDARQGVLEIPVSRPPGVSTYVFISAFRI
jgi:hypothetical protein